MCQLIRFIILWDLLPQIHKQNSQHHPSNLFSRLTFINVCGTILLFHQCLLFPFCPFRKWHTTWTCAMAWWVAFSAVAPDRRCLPPKWCVMPTFTQPPSSTCCTTPSATSSELHMYWWVSPSKAGAFTGVYIESRLCFYPSPKHPDKSLLLNVLVK